VTIYGIRYNYLNGDYRWDFRSCLDDYGYFTDKDAAQKFSDELNRRGVPEARRQHEAEEDSRRLSYDTREEKSAAVRREYDALVEVGIEPSFDRPGDPPPFRERPFDEDQYLLNKMRDHFYNVEEFDEHQDEE
jgi:hypothetical protein